MGNAVQQANAIQCAQTLSATVSIVACVIMLRKVMGERKSNIANRMLIYLLFIDFVLALCYAVGRGGQSNAGYCQFQALLIQWFSIAAMLWMVLMSYQMHQWIVKKKNNRKIEKGVNRSMFAIFLVSGILAFILLGLDLYSFSYLWCWIGPTHSTFRIWCFDTILLATWIIVVVTLRSVSVALMTKDTKTSLDARIGEMLNATRVIQRKLVIYASLFIIIWSVVLTNRLIEFFGGSVIFAVAFLQALILPLQGLFNSLTYGGYLDHISLPWETMNVLGGSLVSSIVRRGSLAGPMSESGFREVVVEADSPQVVESRSIKHIRGYEPKTYSIFTTTFNMGEASTQSIQADLKEWILEGHDIYAIGMQECIDLVGTRSMILDHLGGIGKYAMFTTEIGSGNTRLGYHGFIALTVYVKQSEIQAGFIYASKPSSETMATGTDLLITTAQNKGAVGLPFQIHDTNIGFVTCHLPSDSKGKSKLSKRNASAHSILKEVTLAPEDLGFDLHLQHDHVLVFGDLNYRMETKEAGVNSLTGVAVASLIEKQIMGDDPRWVQRKYNLLRSFDDVLHPSLEEIKLLKQAKVNSKGAWTSVLRADELRWIMDDGDAFSGFEEPMPCFAPSYKRRKGQEAGDCGDYTDPTKIISGFSNTGDIESELAFQSKVKEKEGGGSSKRGSAFSIVGVGGSARARTDSSGGDSPSRERTNSTGGGGGGGGGAGGGLSAVFGRRESAGNPNNAAAVADDNVSEMTDARDTDDLRSTESGRKVQRRQAAATVEVPLTPVTAPKKAVDPRKLRPPSYTDRVLIHSLPDRRERLTVQAYDLCDMMRVSDHRPVSMVLKLQVNANVFYKTPLAIQPEVQKEPHFDLFELCISNVSVRLASDDTAGGDSDDDEEDDDDEDSVYRDSDDVSSVQAASARNKQTALMMENPILAKKHSSLRLNNGNGGTPSATSDSSTPHLPPPGTEIELSATASSSASKKPRPESRKMARFAEPDDNSTVSSEAEYDLEAQNSKLVTAPTSSPKRNNRKKSMLDFVWGSSSGGEATVPAESDEGKAPAAGASHEAGGGGGSSNSPSRPPSRKRSMFSFGTSSSAGTGGADKSPPSPTRKKSYFTKAEADILKEMEADSQWSNEMHQPGEWRQKVLEDERRRKEEKAAAGPTIKDKFKKKRKKKSDDQLIDQFSVVFPLPSKDPLLAHRKIYDFSQVYGRSGKQDIQIEELRSNGEPSEVPLSATEVTNIPKEELLRPMAVFNWPHRDSLRRDPSAHKGSHPPALALGSKFYKVKGCASPELGAHVLLKFTNKVGYDLGSCVVCLSHLINKDAHTFHSTYFTNLQLSSGGQRRGELSGKFSLRFLPSPISGSD